MRKEPCAARAGGPDWTPAAARQLGLVPGIPVTAGHMDAYTPVLGLGVTRPGVMVMVVGTSTGIMTLSRQRHCVKGNRLPEGHLLSGPVGLWFRAGRRWGRLSLVRQPMRSRRLCGQSAAAPSDAAAISYPPGGGASAWRFGPAGAGLVERQPLCLGNNRLSGLFVGDPGEAEDMYRALLKTRLWGQAGGAGLQEGGVGG